MRLAESGIRKIELQAVLADAPASLQFSEHVIGNGGQFHRHACKMALEGIVSKRVILRHAHSIRRPLREIADIRLLGIAGFGVRCSHCFHDHKFGFDELRLEARVVFTHIIVAGLFAVDVGVPLPGHSVTS